MKISSLCLCLDALWCYAISFERSRYDTAIIQSKNKSNQIAIAVRTEYLRVHRRDDIVASYS